MKCLVKTTDGNPRKLKSVTLLTPEGKKMNMKKRYRVVTNSYSAIVSDSPRQDAGRSLNRQTSDMIMKYLDRQQHVSYQGVSRVTME